MPQDEINRLYDTELTSVTKKLRRVASFSFDGLKFGAAFNGCNKLILNFIQYIDWNAVNKSGGTDIYKSLGSNILKFVDEIENAAGIPVVMLGTNAFHDSYILPYNTLDI